MAQVARSLEESEGPRLDEMDYKELAEGHGRVYHDSSGGSMKMGKCNINQV